MTEKTRFIAIGRVSRMRIVRLRPIRVLMAVQSHLLSTRALYLVCSPTSHVEQLLTSPVATELPTTNTHVLAPGDRTGMETNLPNLTGGFLSLPSLCSWYFESMLTPDAVTAASNMNMHNQAKAMRREQQIEQTNSRHNAEHAQRFADIKSGKWDPRLSMPRDRSNDTPAQIEKHKARKVQRKAAHKRRKERQQEAAKEERKARTTAFKKELEGMSVPKGS